MRWASLALLTLVLASRVASAGPPLQAPEAASKFARVERFAGELPRLRAWVDAGLSEPRADRRTGLAAIVRIMDTVLMRVGSEKYTRPSPERTGVDAPATGVDAPAVDCASNRPKIRQHQPSYGASSLLKSHVTLEGDTVRFDFPGKSRRWWHREIRDPQLAAALALFLALPGDRLFQTIGKAGATRPITERHVEELLAGFAGKPKDLRTLHANRLLRDELGKLAQPRTTTEACRNLKSVVRRVAQQLNHYPSTCRASYLDPSVLHAYEQELQLPR